MLNKIHHTEGYVERKADGTFQYNYTLKDHLGNTRVTFADINGNGLIDPNTEINQINHYAPFGMNLEGNWNGASVDAKNKYQYNEKELITDFGLNWNDYGARSYDAERLQWTTIDPLADTYKRWSPYNYCKDNPIKFIDPDGMGVSGVGINQSGTVVYDDKVDDGKFYYFDTANNEKQTSTKDASTISSGKGVWTKNDKTLDFFKALLTSFGYGAAANTIGSINYAENNSVLSVITAKSSGGLQNDGTNPDAKNTLYVDFFDKPILNLTQNAFNFNFLTLQSTVFHEGEHLVQVMEGLFTHYKGLQYFADPMVYEKTIRVPAEVESYRVQMNHSTWTDIIRYNHPDAPNYSFFNKYIVQIQSNSTTFNQACNAACRQQIKSARLIHQLKNKK